MWRAFDHHGKTATVGFVRELREKAAPGVAFPVTTLAPIGKLSAEIAHEINNPLTSVLAFNNARKNKSAATLSRRENTELQDYVRYVNSERPLRRNSEKSSEFFAHDRDSHKRT